MCMKSKRQIAHSGHDISHVPPFLLDPSSEEELMLPPPLLSWAYGIIHDRAEDHCRDQQAPNPMGCEWIDGRIAYLVKCRCASHGIIRWNKWNLSRLESHFAAMTLGCCFVGTNCEDEQVGRDPRLLIRRKAKGTIH